MPNVDDLAAVASDDGAASAAQLFQAGRNCTAVAAATRASILVDGQAYYDAFVQVARCARHSLILVAWDFDTRTCLNPNAPAGQAPLLLGEFLNDLVHRQRHLRIHILNWDYPMIYATDREFSPAYGLGWKAHRRVHLCYDNTHPVGGSHHQKIVVIDDAVAFIGGMDPSNRRWDTCGHKAGDARRFFLGSPYPPVHDVMAMVEGPSACILGDIVRERWHAATGQRLAAPPKGQQAWPAAMPAEFANLRVAVSRTTPETDTRREVREVEALYLDMIGAARRCIYIENLYLPSHTIGDALAATLQREQGPEIVIVSRLLSHGWLEENTMSMLRSRLIRQLQDADRWKRLGIYYPDVAGLVAGTCVDLHSKVMIVDNQWLRVGSANLCNRSMGMDSECDVTFEAGDDAAVAAGIANVRHRLLAEHLDIPMSELERDMATHGSLNAVIRALQDRPRSLKTLTAPVVSTTMMDLATMADPERPVSVEKMLTMFTPVSPLVDPRRPAWRFWFFVVLGFIALFALWRFTPLAEMATPERIIAWAHAAGQYWWAPLFVLLVYTPAALILFPRPLITLFAVIAFGPWQGFAWAFPGVMLSAWLTYLAGRMMDKRTVRRWAGEKLDHVATLVRDRGLLAITAMRLVPVAPFALENVVAGAIRIRLSHYLGGTAIGMLPGMLMTTVFGNEVATALRDRTQINYLPLVVGAVLFVAVIVMVRRYARKRGLFDPPSTGGRSS